MDSYRAIIKVTDASTHTDLSTFFKEINEYMEILQRDIEKHCGIVAGLECKSCADET